MKLSIVTTLYKSSDYIEEFYIRISKEAKKITESYEIIFVDDGSPDDSLSKVIKIGENMKDILSSKWFSLLCGILNGVFAASAFLNGAWLWAILCMCLSGYCFSNFVGDP